jgi:hypothetical protein
MRCTGPLAVVLLLVVGASARGQMIAMPGNLNAAASVNALAGVGVNPYALSTMAGLNANAVLGLPMVNPYLNSTAGLGANRYSMSTSPYGMSGGYGYPYMLNLGRFGGALYGYGYALQGNASLTRANAQYWKDIQTAALQREGVRQETLNTARRRIEFEQWYDSVRPTAVSMRTRQMATDLDSARRAATDTDILSGRALNTLLGSIQKSGKISSGPNLPLDEDIAGKINVTGGTNGNVGLLKDGGKLTWPEGFHDARFDEPRKRLTRNIALAVQTLKDGDAVRPDLITDIRGDAKTIAQTLDDTANDLSPPQYIEARRFLRRLDAGITALADPRVVNYFNNNWRARGKNVAELVTHMTNNGLLFAPASPGDEAAYRAVFQALRAYESGVQFAQR